MRFRIFGCFQVQAGWLQPPRLNCCVFIGTLEIIVQTSAQPRYAGGEYIATDAVADREDRNRRIKAIVGASSGNLVEWYDFYAYAFTSIYFAAAFFPAGTHQPVDGDSRHLRRRFLHAAAGRLAVRLDRRPAWPQELDADLRPADVRRVADDRCAADLRDHRRGGARASAGGAPGAGPFGRRRVRHGGHLHERGRRQGTIAASTPPSST